MGIVSRRLRESARGRACTLHFPNCNHNSETTVLAHLPSPVSGMATKSDDFHAVFACSSCHAAMDLHDYDPRDICDHVLTAIQRTQKIWFEEGYLLIAGDDPKPRPGSKKSLPPKKLIVSG